MEQARWTRLRWRMRGAWLLPAFAACTIAEGALLNLLPVWGSGPHGFLPGVLIAGFLNLFVVAVAAPLAGRVLRRRRRDLPRTIATDYAGTVLLGVMGAGLLVAGIAHHGEIAAEHRARARQSVAVARYVDAQAPEVADRLGEADTLRLEPDLYRTCVPTADPKRWLCLIVNTDQQPAGVTRDHDAVPNEVYVRHGGFN